MAALCGVMLLAGAQAASAQIVVEPTPTPTRSPAPTPTPPPPVQVINADEPARNAVQLTGVISITEDATFKSEAFYTVPLGKRLVIEYVGGIAQGSVLPRVGLVTTMGDKLVIHRFEEQNQGAGDWPGAKYFVIDSPTRIYADPGTKVKVNIYRPDGAEGVFNAALAVYGYLIDL